MTSLHNIVLKNSLYVRKSLYFDCILSPICFPSKSASIAIENNRKGIQDILILNWGFERTEAKNEKDFAIIY